MTQPVTPRLTDDEVLELLARPGARMVVATLLPDGQPHLTVVWYGFLPDGRIAFTIPAQSQKARNLARDSRLTVLVDAGELHGELHGLQLSGRAELDHTEETKLAVHESVASRYPTKTSSDVVRAMSKRVAVVFAPDRQRSWDHRKRLPAVSPSESRKPVS